MLEMYLFGVMSGILGSLVVLAILWYFMFERDLES